MVNKANMMLCIQALRSDEFAQGQGHLKAATGDGSSFTYCCLGVFCEVAKRNGVPVQERVSSNYHLFDEASTALPPSVQNWLGLTDGLSPIDPILAEADQELATQNWNGKFLLTCIGANDRLHWSFGQIADALEAYYITGGDDEPTETD